MNGAASSSASALPPARRNHDDAGKLLLRLSLGLLMLLHGLFKIGTGPGFVVGLLEGLGLPGVLAYGVYVGEIVAPVLLIIGLWTRPAALVVAINMVVAIVLVHTGHFFALTKQGGWALELQGLFLFGALAVALLGAGRYSVGGSQGRFN
ncbi:DoxX family protein [Xenophilus arseniciresistens]|uniref:DoxX family protein n=1 Tax=Xenophilus arseniciresistens TaxID=1283306 RepID=A0AAE3N4K4_9BURK|nr:DoxX family protein [Xenophilus arseniciresistens]MDA7415405.1 DoxX family protein [Xenophilus arseniciresistens]